jgi:hypothetical protein
VAQIEDGKKYQQQYNRLLQAYRRLVKQAGTQRSIPTPREQALLDKQQHYGFNELSVDEQRKLSAEMETMWGQIPAHLQDKARGMAGIS